MKPNIDFLGIGAQKSGTTWLYTHLQKHPQIRFPGGKEIHFWDWHKAEGTDWWLSKFPDSSDGIKQGEITPAYAILGQEDIRTIRELIPEVRLIYIMRNPLARAWSHARMALSRAAMTMDEASDQWFIDHFNCKASRTRGDYLACLKNWTAVFPAENLQLILFDEILADPRRVLARVAQHLAVDAAPFDAIAADELQEAVFAGRESKVRPALISYLQDMYRPAIGELEGHLGRDLRGWLDWDGRKESECCLKIAEKG